VCTPCYAGKYSHVVRVSSCIDCPPGSWSDSRGAATSETCVGCSRGKYSTARGAASAQTCMWCVLGKYEENSYATTCTNCPTGTYSTMRGAWDVANCTAMVLAVMDLGREYNITEVKYLHFYGKTDTSVNSITGATLAYRTAANESNTTECATLSASECSSGCVKTCNKKGQHVLLYLEEHGEFSLEDFPLILRVTGRFRGIIPDNNARY
jgi:hypothetical protein